MNRIGCPRAECTDYPADCGKPSSRMVKLFLRVSDPARYRQPREKSQRGEEVFEFAPNHDFPLTPADSKLAISFMKAHAALSRGSASAAPVPSPSRRPRSSSGMALR